MCYSMFIFGYIYMCTIILWEKQSSLIKQFIVHDFINWQASIIIPFAKHKIWFWISREKGVWSFASGKKVLWDILGGSVCIDPYIIWVRVIWVYNLEICMNSQTDVQKIPKRSWTCSTRTCCRLGRFNWGSYAVWLVIGKHAAQPSNECKCHARIVAALTNWKV